jgi:hypothetical protein
MRQPSFEFKSLHFSFNHSFDVIPHRRLIENSASSEFKFTWIWVNFAFPRSRFVPLSLLPIYTFFPKAIISCDCLSDEPFLFLIGLHYSCPDRYHRLPNAGSVLQPKWISNAESI